MTVAIRFLAFGLLLFLIFELLLAVVNFSPGPFTFPFFLAKLIRATFPVIRDTVERGGILRDGELGVMFAPNVSVRVCEGCPEIRFVDVGLGFGVRDDGIDGGRELWVAVGDSFVFCLGVPLRECWTEILESELGVDVLNAGVLASGVQRSVKVLERVVAVLRPSLVFFGYHPESDVVDDWDFSHPQKLSLSNLAVTWMNLPELLRFACEKSFSVSFALAFYLAVKHLVIWERMKEHYRKVLPYALGRAREISGSAGARFVSICFCRGKEFSEFADVFIDMSSMPSDHLLPDGHLSEKGNRLVANLISRFLAGKRRAYKVPADFPEIY